MDVLRGAFLDLARDQLLDPLDALTRPRRHHRNLADGEIRVFALGHGGVCPDPPRDHPGEKHPRDVPVLDEEPGDAITWRIRLEIGVHAYWTSITTSPGRSRFAPVETMRWPALRPSTTET